MNNHFEGWLQIKQFMYSMLIVLGAAHACALHGMSTVQCKSCHEFMTYQISCSYL